MRYFITGGAGFVGSHLADTVTAAGHDTVLLDDLSTGRLENVQHLLDNRRASFVEGCVTDADLIDDCVRDADVCVHLASPVGVQLVVDNPLATLLEHVRGTDTVMAAAARHGRRLLFSSTSEVYGKQNRGPLSESDDLVIGSPSKSRWSYAIAKCFGEAVAHSYHSQHDAAMTVARLFNAVGPRQTGRYGMVLPRFVRQALEGQDLTVYGDGIQTRCFTHVFDTVRAISMLCDADGAIGNTYNIGSSVPVAVRELAHRVIERAGSDSAIVSVPYEEAYGSGFEELGIRTPDTSALEELIGWQPQRELEDAIDDVIAYERGRMGSGIVANAA
jgi:UDP-glucose 4-epimerase